MLHGIIPSFSRQLLVQKALVSFADAMMGFFCHDEEVNLYHAFYDVQCSERLVFYAGKPLLVTFCND